ncbi:polysaccharide pyruvyl transferase CsaB [Oscillospiraceae bacterium WX1]
MKILMATMSLGIGGAETHIIELACELKRRGFDVVVASNGGVFVADIEAKGIRHYQIPMNRRHLFYMLKSYFLLRNIIKKEKPDIVHAHARISAFICGLLQKTMRFPFVTTAHGVFQLGPGLNQLTNWGQKTIAVSPDIRDYLMTNYHVSPRDIIMTINGIDTDKFSPDVSSEKIDAEFGLDRTKPVVCHVSRLDESASLVARQLIDIAPRLNKALPGVQILIAGGGDVFDALLENAKEANRLTGHKTVIMTGPRTDISDIVSAGDVFVGVSRAALEAMAEAKPVILAGAEGYIGLFTPESVQQARESNFCCRGSALPDGERLLGEIVRTMMILTPCERAKLGEDGRALVLSDYSVSRMTDDCEAAYEAVRRRRFNVVMSGYYGFGNAGDEAILQSIHATIDDSGGDIAITVLSNDPADTTARYGYQAVDRFDFFAVLGALRRCDALVSGGGSLLQDHTSTRSLFYYLTIILAAELLGKKVMIYANGIGPVRKKANRRLVRHIVGRADVISLRDDMSAEELTSMGVQRDDLHVTADPVFTLSAVPTDEAHALLRDCGLPAGENFVCISVRNWVGGPAFNQKIARLCDEIAETYRLSVIFIPMQVPNDVAISLEIIDQMHRPAYLLNPKSTARQIMGVIGLSDFVVAMRLHTLIFSARMGVPVVGIIYDPKVKAYIKALNMPSAGDVVGFNTVSAMNAVQTLQMRKRDYTAYLKERSLDYEQLARDDAARLLELLNTPKNKRRA